MKSNRLIRDFASDAGCGVRRPAVATGAWVATQILTTLIGLFLLGGLTPTVAAETGATPVPAGNQPGMEGVVHGFFDDQTGARIGRLRIDHVRLEYRRQGFLRVAWRPLVVLDGVSLEIKAGTAWPAAGTQIIRALQGGNRDSSVLRNVTVLLDGSPAQRITAPTARLRADHALELSDAVVVRDGQAFAEPGTVCFWLAGPQAGQWTRPPAAIASTTAPSSQPFAVLQPSER